MDAVVKIVLTAHHFLLYITTYKAGFYYRCLRCFSSQYLQR